MRKVTNCVLVVSIFLLAFNAPALADEGHAKEGHHSGKTQYKESGHGKGKHDASCWMSSLNDQQQASAAKMRLEVKKAKTLLMAKITVKKVELANLVTLESPDQQAIDKKIHEILDLKKEAMKKKYAFKVKMRNLLTPEQRVAFDKQLFKKSLHGKGHGHSKKH